jgi:hypothetical protein
LKLKCEKLIFKKWISADIVVKSGRQDWGPGIGKRWGSYMHISIYPIPGKPRVKYPLMFYLSVTWFKLLGKPFGYSQQKTGNSRAPLTHACNPSYPGGRDQEDCSLRPAPGK